uniref:N-acetyltransferase domain-containing protein n=1 Tax=Cuerna arida TaxID=1464854 RepID=A0A1B6FH92_9HEMI
MGNADLLVEVEEKKVPVVLDVLRADGNWPFSFLMHQLIKLMQEFKKSTYCNFKQRLLLVGKTIDEGTIIVLTSFKGNSTGTTYVHIYSCGDDTSDIAAALQNPAVPWDKDQVIFDVVYGGVRPFVLEALKGRGIKYTEATNSLYWINPEEEHKLDERNPPSDVTILFLNEGHAKEINEKWSLKFLDSENMIKDCILTSFGMGVVRKSDRKLLSHGLCNHAGAIFILHTDPAERRKGYASLLITNIIRETIKRQRTPIAIIDNKNSSSESLFKKFNFVPFIPTKYYAVTKT